MQLIQQQEAFPSEHPHVGSVFLRMPFMMPAAQPTPEATVIAFTGQLSAQAPHSMQ
jgi:hypothetical protein